MIGVHGRKGLGANRRPFSCGPPRRPLDEGPLNLERFSSMGLDAVAAILIFLVAMLAINRFEFGRFD
jgi:hypothetical protein